MDIRNVQITDIFLYIADNSEKNKINIYPALVKFILIENIEDFLQGKLVLKDTMNLASVAPILGGEKLTVSIQEVYGKVISNYTFEFVVHSLTGQDAENENMQEAKEFLVLNFCSPFVFDIMSKTFSKRLTGQSETILLDFLKPMVDLDKKPLIAESSDTTCIQDIVLPYWGFKDFIFYLKTQTVSATGYYSYTFRETLKNLRFETVDAMMEAEPIETIKMMGDKNSPSVMRSFRITSRFNFDKFKEIRSAGFNTIYFNARTGETTESVIAFKDVKEKNSVSLGNSMIFTEEMLKKTAIDPPYFDVLDEDEPLIYTIPKRQLRLANLMNYYTLEITVAGNLSRKTGDLISVIFPPQVTGKLVDEQLTGNYIISEITNHIDEQNIFEQTLRLNKDAFLKSDLTQAISNGKKNIIKLK